MKIFSKLVASVHPLLPSVFFISIAAVFTLFAHWEMTHETWQYWFFARVLGESGRFVIPDRSPVYILYLQLFRPLGYPMMINAEYVVTTCITSIVLILFLKRFMPIVVAAFGVIVWLPYLQISEPSVQKLAMAFCLLAILLREKYRTRNHIAWSYVFFLAAYFTRANYGVVLLLYVLRDIWVVYKRQLFRTFRFQIKSDWPIIAGLIFSIAIYLLQSPHPWNNVWGATTTYFPSNGKSFNILQNYNASFILEKYGMYQDHDFFESNKEVFGGANTTLGAIRANPEFFRRVAWEYTKVGVANLTNLTQIPAILKIEDTDTTAHIVIVVTLFFGAFLVVFRKLSAFYVLGVGGMLVLTFLFLPNKRYFIAVVPVLLMSAGTYAWITVMIINAFLRAKDSVRQIILKIVYPVFALLFVYIFSSGPTSTDFSGVFRVTWPNLIHTVIDDYKKGDLKSMEFRDTSIYFPPVKSAYKQLSALSGNCKGIMTLEYTFLGAFTNIPIHNIYDIWEIPPFGSLNDPTTPYHGLTSDRVNCLFISKNLRYGVGAATNSQIRYENYIEPYAKYLQSLGAKTYQIEGYGEAIVLR